MRTFASGLAALAFLGGCASIDFDRLEPGTLTGNLFVMWVGEGSPGGGDGKFLFVPDPQHRLTFRRPNGRGPGALIRPEMMYTDGGSIPSIAQAFNGLHPWGYAPAYMIHDWIFAAHHCLVDDDPDPRYRQVSGVTFHDSAAILGEAIQALVATNRVKRNDLAGNAITAAVDSPVARNLWDARGGCADAAVSDADRQAANDAIPGSAALARSFRAEARGRLTGTRPAKVVARIAF